MAAAVSFRSSARLTLSRLLPGDFVNDPHANCERGRGE
jgi:hypothetical protein